MQRNRQDLYLVANRKWLNIIILIYLKKFEIFRTISVKIVSKTEYVKTELEYSTSEQIIQLPFKSIHSLHTKIL